MTTQPDQPDPSAVRFREFFDAIENTFVQLGGKRELHGSQDVTLVTRWQDYGIPLQIVLRGITKAFKSPRQKYPINSLQSCEWAVEEECRAWLSKIEPPDYGEEVIQEPAEEVATEQAVESEESQPQPFKEKKWYDTAQDILEGVLKEADKNRDGKWKDVPPFITIWPKPCPPEYAHIAHLLPKHIILSYKIVGEGFVWDEEDEDAGEQCWEATLLLNTESLPQDVYSRCRDSLNKFLSSNITTDKKGSKRPLSDILSADAHKELLEAFAKETMYAVVYRLLENLEITFNEHWREAHLLGYSSMVAHVTSDMQDAGVEVIYDPDEPLASMDRLLAQTTAQRRALLKNDLALCLGAPDFGILGELYDKMLIVWKDAKLIYKQNNKRPTWRELIRAAHPDVEFDDDLLSRLSGKLNDLPEDVQAKLSEKGGDSKPSSIALEHAARLCGAPDYEYSLRHLYNLKNEAKQRALENGEETDGDYFTETDTH